MRDDNGRGRHGDGPSHVEVRLVEAELLVREGESALVNLSITLRLASTNVVRAAERLIDPGAEAAQVAIFLSARLDDLAEGIERTLLGSLRDDT